MRASEVMIKDRSLRQQVRPRPKSPRSCGSRTLGRSRGGQSKDRHYMGTISDRDIVARVCGRRSRPTDCSAAITRAPTPHREARYRAEGLHGREADRPQRSPRRSTIVVLNGDKKVWGSYHTPKRSRVSSSSRVHKFFTLAEANRTLPLVRRVVQDIMAAHPEWKDLVSRYELVCSQARPIGANQRSSSTSSRRSTASRER